MAHSMMEERKTEIAEDGETGRKRDEAIGGQGDKSILSLKYFNASYLLGSFSILSLFKPELKK